MLLEEEETMRIAFLNPGDDSDPFYSSVSTSMRQAADSLDVELEIIECHRDVGALRSKGRSVISRDDPPDYFITANENHEAVDLIPEADAKRIKTFLVFGDLLAADKHRIGAPREPLLHWVGTLVPDDRQGGYELGRVLIDAARSDGLVGSDGKIHLCAIGGPFTTNSLQRISGLRVAVAEYDTAVVDKVIPAFWDRDKARKAAAEALGRSIKPSVIWCASDWMAFGVLDAVQAAGLTPRQDVHVGGIDWSPAAFERIADGTLTASVGGHFIDGSWAIVLLHDYHGGIDFGEKPLKSKFVTADARCVKEYQAILTSSEWGAVDFKRFSKIHNPRLSEYELSISAILHHDPADSRSGS